MQLPSKDDTVGNSSCPEGVFIVGDMGDGDYKQITIKGDKFTIVPHGNKQSWTVNSIYDLKSCSASIDFHVPGKPNPPPVKALTLTAFRMINGDHIHVSMRMMCRIPVC